MLKREDMLSEIESETGISLPTIRRVRRAMEAGGWKAPVRERKAVVTAAIQKDIARLLDQGVTIPKIAAELGITSALVTDVRRDRVKAGWSPVTVREIMTPATRVEKHPAVVSALLSGATYRNAAEAGGVSVNAVRIVARSLKSLGRWPT